MAGNDESFSFEIEDNVPIPEDVRTGRPQLWPWDKLAIGQSVVVPERGRNSAWNWSKNNKLGRRLITRQEGQGRFRIWRVTDPEPDA